MLLLSARYTAQVPRADGVSSAQIPRVTIPITSCHNCYRQLSSTLRYQIFKIYCKIASLNKTDVQRSTPAYALVVPRCSYSLEYSRLQLNPSCTHRQSSPASLAYTLLGGFVISVSALYVDQIHLIVFEYNLASLAIKERVRYMQLFQYSLIY